MTSHIPNDNRIIIIKKKKVQISATKTSRKHTRNYRKRTSATL